MLKKLNPLKRLASRAGTVDEERSTFWTTPWAWRDSEGCYRGHNKEVWLYRQMTVHPMRWEDPQTRLSLGSPLATLLYELGETSKDMGVGIRALARNREIHILSVTWEEEAKAPEGTPAELAEYMAATLQFVVPVKALVIGVKLWPSMAATGQGILDQIRNQATSALDEEGPGFEGFEADRRMISEILSRNGAHIVPNRVVRDQIESWYNLGRGPDVSVMETKDLLFVDDFDRIEMAAVMGFENPIMYAPDAMWALDAGTHPAGASVISVRGVIEPSSVSRNRVRRSQRRVIAQIEEEAATGDLDRPEQSMSLGLAQEVERFILNGREPLISECSILMARRVGPDAQETYIDELRGSYGIEMKPLEHRQMAALDETLPTSSKRVNPFLQDVSVAMLAHCGLQGHSNLGDPTGVYVGLVDPDYSPCYLNPLGAPAADKPPAMLVAGDPGSGKLLTLGTRIPVPGGWTTMGELAPGDMVFGRDGAPCQVTYVSPIEAAPKLYDIHLSDGQTIRACADHQWIVANEPERRSAPERGRDALLRHEWEVRPADGVIERVLTTRDLLTEGVLTADGAANFAIRVTHPVELPHQDLPVDPYVLGTQLADGSKGDTGSADEREGAHIDVTYLRASAAQRQELLRGLVDTNGLISPDGSVELTLFDETLAADALELVRSLGVKASMNVGGAPIDDDPARPSTGLRHQRLRHQILFRPAAPVLPPPRTQPDVPETVEGSDQWLYITDVTEAPTEPGRCIQVDSPDHSYLAGSGFVPTHNTFLCQNLALQAALGGLNVIFINPKGMSTLAGLTTIAPRGKVVNLSEIEKEGGYFDPFRFTEQTPAGRQIAADIAGQHILGVLGTRGVAGMGFTQEQEISLLSGLRAGADRGARCVAEALQAVEDPQVRNLVMQQASDPLFRLGVGMHAMPPYNADRGLLLIEFDRPLDIPEKGIAPSDYTRTQRLALSAVRLVTRASLEILGGSGGGMLIVDEAWMFLQSSEGLAALQSMGRLGRSQNILPVFATQRVDDLLKEGVDMESYLSRVFVMTLSDEREARAALRLCGLEATAERIAWLREAGPRRGENGQPSRGAMALHRDLNDRHSAVLIGPVPQAAREAFTTNPEDLKRRQVEAAARAAEAAQQR